MILWKIIVPYDYAELIMCRVVHSGMIQTFIQPRRYSLPSIDIGVALKVVAALEFVVIVEVYSE